MMPGILKDQSHLTAPSYNKKRVREKRKVQKAEENSEGQVLGFLEMKRRSWVSHFYTCLQTLGICYFSLRFKKDQVSLEESSFQPVRLGASLSLLGPG